MRSLKFIESRAPDIIKYCIIKPSEDLVWNDNCHSDFWETAKTKIELWVKKPEKSAVFLWNRNPRTFK